MPANSAFWDAIRRSEAKLLSVDPHGNELLATLPGAVLNDLLREGAIHSKAPGTVLCEAGVVPEAVCFPLDGIIALTTVMKNGKMVQAAMIGRDGVFAGMTGLGAYIPITRAIVRTASSMFLVPSPAFQKMVSSNKCLVDLCLRSNNVHLAQAFAAAACNAMHSTERRLCRLLLEMSDQLENETILVTQEILGQALGVRRTSVTEIATKLKSDKIVNFKRGTITILQMDTLKAKACECYAILRNQTP